MLKIVRKRRKTIPTPSGDGLLRQYEYEKGELVEKEAINLHAQINSYVPSFEPSVAPSADIGSTDFDLHDLNERLADFGIEYQKLQSLIVQKAAEVGSTDTKTDGVETRKEGDK